MQHESIWIKETALNITNHYSFGASDWYETSSTEQGELFRNLRSDHGRCIGKMFIDGAAVQPQHVGWVFQQRRKYDDSNDKFLAETWVTFRKGEPEPHCAGCGTVHGSGHGVTLI